MTLSIFELKCTPNIVNMEFEDKLQRAIQRGQERTSARANAQKKVEASKEDIRNRHNEFRLNLSDHIEACLKKVGTAFSGLRLRNDLRHKGLGGSCFPKRY